MTEILQKVNVPHRVWVVPSLLVIGAAIYVGQKFEKFDNLAATVIEIKVEMSNIKEEIREVSRLTFENSKEIEVIRKQTK